jgi:hypothetical protein
MNSINSMPGQNVEYNGTLNLSNPDSNSNRLTVPSLLGTGNEFL